jgi:hypothetical protein
MEQKIIGNSFPENFYDQEAASADRDFVSFEIGGQASRC